MIPDNNAAIIAQGFSQSKTKRKLVIVGDVPYTDAYADALRQTKDRGSFSLDIYVTKSLARIVLQFVCVYSMARVWRNESNTFAGACQRMLCACHGYSVNREV